MRRVLLLLGVGGIFLSMTGLVILLIQEGLDPWMLLVVAGLIILSGSAIGIAMSLARDMLDALRLIRQRTQKAQERTSRLERDVKQVHKLVDRVGAVNRRYLDDVSTHLQSLSPEADKRIADLARAVRDHLSQLQAQLTNNQQLTLTHLLRTSSKIDEISTNTDNISTNADKMAQDLRQRVTHRRDLKSVQRELEGVIASYLLLKPKVPFPQFGDWAVEGDLGSHLVRLIHFEKPTVAVEAGSGLSTLLIGAAMRNIGSGHLIALEHDQQFAQSTKHQLDLHDLDEFVELVHAPLTRIDIGGEIWSWYDLSDLELPNDIELLLVDGPPANIGRMSRYPALPILEPHLSENAVVLLDDADREDEKQIVERWTNESGWTATMIPFERGTAELRRA